MTYDEMRAAHPNMRRAMDMLDESRPSTARRACSPRIRAARCLRSTARARVGPAAARQAGSPYYVGELSGLHLVEIIEVTP
jgi:hypothetical protein